MAFGAVPDFHTHHPTTERPALVSLPLEACGSVPLASLSFHPWEVKEDFTALPEAYRLAAPAAAALGETGLDRLRGAALPMQQRAFEAVVRLAEEARKPVVVHCVRAWSEVEALHRQHPGVRMLIHGFTGGPERLTALRRAGFWLSLGRRALQNPRLTAFLKNDGWHRLGLESDDDPAGLKTVLALCTSLFACTERDLAARTAPNFEEFLR